MGWAYSTHGRGKKCVQNWSENPNGREYLV